MLVLSRKVGEEIVIDGNIRVVINRVAGDRVTLAFSAPSDVRILRAELALQEETVVTPIATTREMELVAAAISPRGNAVSATAIAQTVAPKLPTGPRFKAGGQLPLVARRAR